MSALCPKTGLMQQGGVLFDHFVGDRKHVGRYVEGGLEVDDELLLGRKLDRQVARLGAAQDAIHVGWHAPIHIGEACFVLEADRLPLRNPCRNRRHVVAERVPYHHAAISVHEIIGQRGETCLFLPERCDDPLYVAIVPHFGDERLYSQLARGGLERTQIIQTATGRRIRVEHRRRPPNARDNSFQQSEQLASERAFEIAEPGGVAAWARQVVNNPRPDRIGYNEEDDRDRVGLAGVPVAMMISGWEATNSLAIILIRSMLLAPQRRSICTLRPLSQPNCESVRRSSESTNRSSANPLSITNPPHKLRRLLRPRSERPRGRRGTDERDKQSALHSMTSSASASSLSEIWRPSILAVFTLMASSNLVGC